MTILALGIGANTAVFSVVDAVLLRRFPFTDPDQLVLVWEKNATLGPSIGERVPPAYTNFDEWSRQAKSFDELAGFETANLNLTGPGDPERIEGARVSPNFFHLLGVRTVIGTLFNLSGASPGDSHVAILSHSFWQEHFGGQRNMVGQPIVLNDAEYTVIGVLPADFYLPSTRQGTDQRKPEVFVPYGPGANGDLAEQNRRKMFVFGRLRAGVSLAQARAEMDGLASRLEKQNPVLNAGFAANVFPIYEEDVGQEIRHNLLVLSSATTLVLLIACANLGNLVLGRAKSREHELAIRKALGATRGDLIVEMLVEALVLSCCGGLLALGLAQASIKAILALKPAEIVRPESIQIGMPVLLFTMSVSVVAAVLFGILPAVIVSRADVHSVLKREGDSSYKGAEKTSSVLVITEVGLTTVLLIAAGLLVRSLQRVLQVDPGFRPDHVLTMQFSMPANRYPTRNATAIFCRNVLERVSALPGVKAASFSDGLPMTRIRLMKFTLEDQPAPKRGSEPTADMRGITSPGYFAALGIPILEGRNFSPNELNEDAPVLIINQALAKKLWTGQSAVGKHLLGNIPSQNNGERVRYTVIGVEGNAHQLSLEDDTRPEITRPMVDYTNLSLAVRSGSDPAALTAAVERQVWGIDKSLPVYNVQTMQEVLDETLSQRRFNSALFKVFGGLGVVLACIGIYGVLSFGVVQRTREFGVRIAVGAAPRDVFGLVFGKGLLLVTIGMIAGLGTGLALSRVLSTVLYDLPPTDFLTYFYVCLLMLAVACAACYLPARNAMTIDPMEALRGD